MPDAKQRRMASYYCRLWSRTWLETKIIWTPYRWWFFFAPPVGAVFWLLRRKGWGAIMSAPDVLINVAGGGALALLAFLGSLVISYFRAPRLLDDERIKESEAGLRSVKDEHQQTKAALNAMENELATEREKNRRPDISASIVGGTYYRRSQGDSIGGDGHHFRRKKIYLALIIEFRNSRPQTATIDHWDLVVEGEGSRFEAELTIQQEFVSARVFPERTMEDCLVVPYGQTVKRCEHFSIEEKVRLDQVPVAGSVGVTEQVERGSVLFDQYEATLKLSAVDSFQNRIETTRVTGDWFSRCNI